MTSKKPLGLPPVLLILGVLVLLGLAGFAAVYVKGMGSGNGAGVATETASAEGCQIAPAKKAALIQAARGEVAAMTPLDEPRRLDLVFKDADGKDRKLSDFTGKTVLLNLWATWCYPCREEMPALDRLENQAGGNQFEVVAINIDSGSDEKPKKFLADNKIASLATYRDSTMKVFNTMKRESLALGLPVTLLIDNKGCALGAMNGPAKWDSADAKALIEAVSM